MSEAFEAFHILQKLPTFIMTVQRKAREMHKKEKALFLLHWKQAKQAVALCIAGPCFSADVAREQEVDGFSDDQAAYHTGHLLEAGSNTTSNTLYAFVQAMLLFPEVQARGQQEIDRVAGPNHLPDLTDMAKLPYVRAMMKESMRWFPTGPLGFPHAVTKDDTYRGYCIPAGATVAINIYGIHMDPARYPEPRRFNPDRHKEDSLSSADSAANPDVSKRDHFAFGAGRRICPGMHIVDRSLFFGIARLLWAFDIKPHVLPDGSSPKVDPDKYTHGFVCRPESFEASITPRSAERERIIRREWNIAKMGLDPETLQWRELPEGMKKQKL